MLKPEFDPAISRGCFVGLLDARELADGDYTRHLSVDERTRYMALPSSIRKSEWLAGRLAAKYLFLSGLESRQTQDQQWRPTLTELSADALGVYSPWMFQKVEVVANSGKPGLAWCGRVRPESISLSHRSRTACASIALGSPIAVDIETAIPRIDAFYRNNFSEAERSWVNRAAGYESNKAHWFFTFLWTLKESAMKLGFLSHASVWNLPRIEIDGLACLDPGHPFSFSNTSSGDFALFRATVKERSRLMPVRVAVKSTRNFILTVMNPLDGAVK